MKPEELEDMTTLTIKTNALDNNIRIIKRLANGAKVIAVFILLVIYRHMVCCRNSLPGHERLFIYLMYLAYI